MVQPIVTVRRLYTDGSYHPQHRVGAIGICGDDIDDVSVIVPVTSAYLAEMTAATHAIALAFPLPNETVIYTDNIPVFTRLGGDGRPYGWLARAPMSLLVNALIVQLRADRRVTVQYVKGHTGVAGNVKAHNLARQAVRTEIERRKRGT